MTQTLVRALVAAVLAVTTYGWSSDPAQATTSTHARVVVAATQPRITYRFRAAVRHLRVHRETHAGSYDRDADFGDWIEQGGGCDTRAVVLKAESQTATTQNEYCTIESGQWLSPYDGVTYADPADVQVDHVVPVGNAWAAGAWHWTQATRIRYYNDLKDPRTLVAVDNHDNESKSDQTPDEWLPPAGDCSYARNFTSVKLRWGLTVTRAEQYALIRLSTSCPNRRIGYVQAKVQFTRSRATAGDTVRRRTCVTAGQYAQVRPKMALADVAALLNGKGAPGAGHAGGFGRTYPECESDRNRVTITYEVPVRDSEQVGPARVAETFWSAPHRGDVNVRVGNDRSNTLDLEERIPYRERVFLFGGDDYVFQRSNGLPDVIDCGEGNDTVYLYDGRESHDVYRNCEHIKPYSP